MDTASLKQLLLQIADLPEDQLRSVNSFIVQEFRRRQALKAAVARSEFRVGDKVSFTSKGTVWVGTLHKLNRKTATVHVMTPGRGVVVWRVSIQLLKAVNVIKTA